MENDSDWKRRTTFISIDRYFKIIYITVSNIIG